MQSKSAKYFVNHNIKGMKKGVAAREAGISDVRNVGNIEKTETYQKLATKYAEVIKEQIGMEQVAFEHAKNIVQDQDKGAKNNAIKLFLERVEPEAQKKEKDDQLIVILRD